MSMYNTREDAAINAGLPKCCKGTVVEALANFDHVRVEWENGQASIIDGSAGYCGEKLRVGDRVSLRVTKGKTTCHGYYRGDSWAGTRSWVCYYGRKVKAA